MKLRFHLDKVAGSILLCAALAAGTLTASATLDGRWVHHPGASMRTDNKEGQTDRIIDGNRYVYFFVRGDFFNRGNKYLYTSDKGYDPIQIFRYDKKAPWSGDCLRPVASDIEVSGGLPLVYNYSYEEGVLAVVYDNNKIDFIFDDGRLISSSALADIVLTGEKITPYSVSFDIEKPVAYMAGNFGYVAFNTNSGNIEEFVTLDKETFWATRVGDKMVVLAGTYTGQMTGSNSNAGSCLTDAYVFPAGKAPSKLADPLQGSANLQVLMPIKGDAFLALTPGNSESVYGLCVYLLSGDNWQKEMLTENYSIDLASSGRYRHFFRTDGFALPASKGYALYDINGITLIDRNIAYSTSSSSADYKAKAMTVISKASLGGEEKKAKMATGDGSRAWIYTYDSAGKDGSPRGLYYRDFSGSWGAASEVGTPFGPSTALATSLKWTPVHGLLVRGPGSFFDDGSPDRDYFSSYKDGRWKDLSYAANNAKYEPLSGQMKHIAVDPLNPDWVWSNATFSGFLRMDLGNYDNFLMLGSDNNPSWENTYPGFFSVFKRQPAYGTLINFSQADFDNEGRMWFARYTFNEGNDMDYEDIIYGKMSLYYYTAAERKAIASIGADKGLLTAPHELVVPYTYGYHNGTLLAMKSPGNENLLAYTARFVANSQHRPFIYDHNGTPDDTSDDRMVFLVDLINETGGVLSFSRMYSFYEDKEKGEVWFFTSAGPVIINPRELLDGSKSCRRPHISRREGVAVDDYPLEQIAVNQIVKDIYGRMWIATEVGLYCLSADGEELLGYYTVDNSPLPSDEILTVECDGSTGAVYVSTTRGLMEFQPEGSTPEVEAGEHLAIWPSAVTPDYNGYVNMSGAIDGYSYEVVSADGEVVASLGKPDSGKLQWNCRTAAGSRVKPGRYSARRAGIQESNPFIIL